MPRTIALKQFTAPAYRSGHQNQVDRMLNLFIEKTELGNKIITMPGYLGIGTVGNDQPCRGAIAVETASYSKLYSVHGNTVYSISSGGIATSIGTIGTSSGFVSMCFGTSQAMFVDGADGWVITLATDALTQITDGNFPASPTSCAWHSQRFLANNTGTGVLHVSELNDALDWTPAAQGTAESRPDNLIGIAVTPSTIYLLGALTTEPWVPSGTSPFFEPIPGGSFPFGIEGPGCFATFGDSVYVVGSNANGIASVYEVSGGQSRVISTPDIERLISGPTGANTTSEARVNCYQISGHRFCEVNEDANTNIVYDIGEGEWSEITLSDGLNSLAMNAIVRPFASSSGTIMGFNRSNGTWSSMRDNVHAVNTNAVTRTRSFGPIASKGNRLFHYCIRFELEADNDNGLTYTFSATLEWTDDSGLTWSAPITLSKSITALGQTPQRISLEARRLGSSYERFYRLTWTTAAKVTLKSATLHFEEGAH